MTSAVNPWDTESHPSVGHLPARHICLILFGRIVLPPAGAVSAATWLLSGQAALGAAQADGALGLDERGASGRTRTNTPLRATDFESAASTNSATEAPRRILVGADPGSTSQTLVVV